MYGDGSLQPRLNETPNHLLLFSCLLCAEPAGDASAPTDAALSAPADGELVLEKKKKKKSSPDMDSMFASLEKDAAAAAAASTSAAAAVAAPSAPAAAPEPTGGIQLPIVDYVEMLCVYV